MEEDTDNTDIHKRKDVNSELEEILRHIADLDKRRALFNARGLELKTFAKRPPERYNAEEDAEDVSGSASATKPLRAQAHQLTVPYSIPRALAVHPSLGGKPVSPELAVSLRKTLFGNVFHIFNYEWKKSCFKFREPYSALSYALEAERGGARAIQMVVQANIIKYLLFSRKADSDCYGMQSLEEVDEKEQEHALASALADILWTAGDEQAATVTLVTSDRCFTPVLDYKSDSFTERLQLFNFLRKEDTQRFIYEHIQCFKEEGSHGVILFLYSLILTRTIDRLREDLDKTTTHLLQQSLGNFVCRQALLNLLLTGRASPNVFNGTLLYDENGDLLEHPLHGVLARSDVGYLHWSREQVKQGKLPAVGSMLKTPKLPVWVCSINDTYSIIFSPHPSLLSDWKMEHLFNLYFYNGQSTQTSTALLTIDTHSHHWEVEKRDVQGDPEKRFPSVEMTIRTKWEGAAIDWNGIGPFY
ncbi:inactive ubiquitin carboxyl-terminal hydrolase MINDY-4B [Clupea harengus]|uniref:Inactive ubiquitin carboxyl-terminal hydrolase MINDY-4B n=1 Tax=Clupea harengus TaxID=7950 RepID=A0A6P3VRM3_CLUHA|nr:inactive ubiquitin carboxyl-terminal hydrolase MINDY-4B [Clupea harengus]